MLNIDESKVCALLESGQKIMAIKLVMQETGVGLAQAKDYVDGLDGTGSAESQEPADAPAPTQEAHGWVNPVRVRYLLEDGKKLEAVRYVHEQGGFSLKAAKDFVEGPEFAGVAPRKREQTRGSGPEDLSAAQTDTERRKAAPKQSVFMVALLVVAVVVAAITVYAGYSGL